MFIIKDLNTDPGTKIQGYMKIYDEEYEIPVTIINGKSPGKTALITGGIHGGEFTAVQTVIELASEIVPDDIKGKIILIHPVNTEAFYEKMSFVMPKDNENLNRLFPGKKDGSLAEKTAYFLTEFFHEEADIYIDVHGGDLHEMTVPYVYYPGNAKENVILESKKAAELFDVKYMVKSKAESGSYNSAALNKDVPSVLIESGGLGICQDEFVKLNKNNIYRVLNFYKITSKDIVKQSIKPTEISTVIYLEAHERGCWYPVISEGELIKKGQLIGIVKDFFGKTLNEYYAEFDGVILYYTKSLGIETSEVIAAYGKLN